MPTPKLNREFEWWVTADTHFGHRRVAEFYRKFTSREDHDEYLINQHNSLVGSDDVVIHCGDVSFWTRAKTLALFERLNGHIVFVPGNHDSVKLLHQIVTAKHAQGKSLSEVWPKLHEVKFEGVYLSFSHYPLAAWNHSDSLSTHSFNLHGHLHGSSDHHHAAPYRGEGVRIDIGVDNSLDYNPINLRRLIQENPKRKVE